MNEISMKEYDTLLLVCEYQDDSDTPIDLSAITVTADIRSKTGTLYESLRVNKLPQAGSFSLSRVEGYLPSDQYRIDVLFTNQVARHRVASETFILNVEQAITLPRV